MSEKLEELIVAVQLDLQSMKREIERGKSMTESLRRSIETHTRASGDSFRQMENTVKSSVNGQAQKIEVLKASYVKMAAAATAAFFAVKKAWNMADAAASLEEQKGALEILGRQYGQTADQIVAAVKEASGAQLSMRDSTDLATKALQAGFSPQQVAKLVRGAEMLADRMGGSIPDAFEKLIHAVKTGKEQAIAMHFANLKLTSSLEGEEDQLGATSVQGENFARVAVEIDNMQRQLAGSTDSTADRMARFSADVQDMSEYINTTALRATAALAASMMGIKEAAEYASLALSSMIADSARGLAWLNENMPFADDENRKKAMQFRAVQSGADADVRRLEGQFSESARRGNSFLDIMYNGPVSGVVSPRSNVRATGTDYLNILKGWKKQRTGSGGGGTRSGASSAASVDKVGAYLADLQTATSEVGMSDYEVGMTRVIAKLKELGATEAQISQGQAIFAAGFRKKEMLEGQAKAAEYARDAISQAAGAFEDLEQAFGMNPKETEAARAAYAQEATDPLAGLFGDLDQTYGMNPKATEGDRNAMIESYKREGEAVIANLTPYTDYIMQLNKLNDLRAKGIIDTDTYLILETNAAEALRIQEQNTSQFNGTLAERQRLELMLTYAVREGIISGEDMVNTLLNYEQAIGRLELATPKFIRELGQLSEGFGQALTDWNDAFDVTKDIQKTVSDFANGVTDSFFAMIQSGQDFGTSMSGVLKTILADIASMVFQISIVQPLMSGITGALSGAGLITLPAGKATGGFVQASMPYIVGERGPELFVPGGSGTIIPNDQLAGSVGQSVNVTLNVPAGVSRAELMQILPAYRKATMAAIADANQRGGSFSAALG